MRVVLDTNVFISALLGGRLAVILDEWRARRLTLVVSEATVREYLDVMRRPRFKITEEEIAATVDYLLKTVEFVTPLETISAIEADPSDNKFLDAAIVGEVAYIVSGDRHLLELKSFRDIPIITSRELIERLAKETR